MTKISQSPTRYPNGVSNAILPSMLENMGQPDPSRFHNFFDDFNTFNPTSGEDWIVTFQGSAVGMAIDEKNGILQIANTASTATDHIFIQSVGEIFKF